MNKFDKDYHFINIAIDKTEQLISKYKKFLELIANELFSKGITEYGQLRKAKSGWKKINLSKFIDNFPFPPDCKSAIIQTPSNQSVELEDNQYLLPQYLFLYLKYQVDKPGLLTNPKGNPAAKNVRVPMPDLTEQYLICDKLESLINKVNIETEYLSKLKYIKYNLLEKSDNYRTN